MKYAVRLAVSLIVLPLSGCGGITLGPTVEREAVVVHRYDDKGRPLKVGQVIENKRLKCKYVTVDGKEFVGPLDVGGMDFYPPELPEQPKEVETPK